MTSRADRAIQLIRTNPDADVTALIETDAAEMIERVISAVTMHAQTIGKMRRLMIEFVRGVYAAAAEVVTREHNLRVTAALDAADARARYDALNATLETLIVEVHDSIPGAKWDEFDETKQADIRLDPVGYLRVALGYDTRTEGDLG